MTSSSTRSSLPDQQQFHQAISRGGNAWYAVNAGYVEQFCYFEAYGHYVIIDHGNGYKTKYANNRKNKVEQGDYVDARQKIAEVGNSSRDSIGPHLHFEVRLRDARVDPESFFFAPGM